MSVLWFIVSAYVLVVGPIQAARILFYIPTPSISHQVVYRPLAQTLASRGHNVTVITADPAFPKGKAPANLTEIDLHDISYEIWQEQLMKEAREDVGDLRAQLATIMKTMYMVLDKQLQDEQIQTLVNDKNKQFDLLLLEAVLPPLLVFSHIYKAPVIQVSTFGALTGTYESVGAPTHPLLYPLNTRQKLRDLTLWDKFTEVFIHYAVENLWYSFYDVGDNILKKHFGPAVPKIEELVNNIDMVFMNIHPMFEGIRPVPPNVVYLHGLHQKPTKDLPQDLKSYLDSSKHGVIYVSFGTNVDPALLLPEKIQILLRVFSQLPYDVLWKWSKDELPGRSPNIRIAKWFPQPDLLKHPNVKLFITQGGLQSTDEAITAGVPLIGMPMLGDQHFNVERYVSYGFGIKLDMKTLTEEKLKHAINATIADDSYRRNMERFRTIINDSPQTPLERAVWWTEYVLRHGDAKHLRAPSANISWRQYLELDLVLILLSVLLIAVTVSVIVLRLVYRAVRSYLVSDVKIKRN
ncbi:UDP-glycosyltransferase UGT4 [Spodoptera frugiperda]|uniref:UDP-glucuronosyltransferase n=1 Tax=Spodoptera frugiperda TaxID=7108 RepID=A0A9R0EJE1_SPOFR|nr:UDP-glycosyltransferase UGT4 [Spodoptera frugiperda]